MVSRFACERVQGRKATLALCYLLQDDHWAGARSVVVAFLAFSKFCIKPRDMGLGILALLSEGRPAHANEKAIACGPPGRDVHETLDHLPTSCFKQLQHSPLNLRVGSSRPEAFVVKGWSWETSPDVDAGGMAPCRFGEVCWRPLCPYRHSGKGRAARWAAVWVLLAGQEEELVEVVKDISEECFSERIVEKTVEIAGFSKEKDATSAAATAVGESAFGVGLLGSQSAVPRRKQFSQCPWLMLGHLGPGCVTRPASPLQQSQILLMKLDLQVLRNIVPQQNQHPQCRPVMLDPLDPEQVARPAQPLLQQMQSLLLKLGLLRLRSTALRQAPAVGPAGEACPRGIAKQSTTTESDIVVSSGEAGPSWPRANDMNSAAATVAVKSAGEFRPPGIAKHSATTKPELAESSGEAGSPW